MVLAVGLDIVEIARIERAMQNPRFLTRILTPTERASCKTPAGIAGRWAAKEAIAKTLPLKLTWQDVEIVAGQHGGPVARVTHPGFQPDWKIEISITHERTHAAAVAILHKN